MGVFDDLIPARPAGSLFSDLIPAPQPTVGAAPPGLPGLPAAPTSLADVLMQSLAPSPMPAMPGAIGPDMPPSSVQSVPSSVPSGWMAGQFGEGHITDMAAPAPINAPVPDQIADIMDGPTDDSTLAGDLWAAWLQAQQIGPGNRMAGGIKQIDRAADIGAGGDLARSLGFDIAPEDAADMAARQQGLVDRGVGMVAEAVPGSAELSEQIAGIPMNPAARAVGDAESFGEGLSAAAGDPGGVLRSFGVRSLGTSVPTMLAAIAGSALGPAGAAGAAGATGGGIEAAMSVGSDVELALREAGIDVSSPEAVAAFVNANPDAFRGMLETAVRRAGVIAAADALTGGVTGQLARTAARAGRPGTITGHVAAGGAVEPLGEAAGEAGAQLATTGEIRPGEVLAEALGGAGIGVPTTAGQVAVEMAKRPAPRPQSSEAPSALADLVQQFAPPPAARPVPDALPPSEPVPNLNMPAAPVAPAPEAPPQPQESYAPPAPVPSPPAPPPSLPPAPGQPPVEQGAAAPVVESEPPTPRRKPFTNLVRRAGIQIDPDGPAGQELRNAGVTPRSHPGLFRRGAHTDLDNLVGAEHPELEALVGREGDTEYLAPSGILEALISEANGQPVRGADQAEIASVRREWNALQAEQAEAWAAEPIDDRPPAWRIAHPEQDFTPAPERVDGIRSTVDEAVQSLGVTVTPEEVASIVAGLDRDGGDVEMAIERAIIRSILDAESAEPAARGEDFPGFEAAVPGEDAGPGAGGPRPAGRDGVPEGGGDAGTVESGRARAAPGFSTELTPEGEQLLVPGTEQRQTGEAQRQRAELAARQQQSKMRRLGQQRIEDDEGSLFGESPPDLFGSSGGQAAPDSVEGPPSSDTPAVKGAAEPTVDRGGAGARSAPETPAPPAGDRDAEGQAETEAAPAPPGVLEDRAAPARRRPGGRLSPTFLDFSFTNRQSVYGAAFRAAGLEPDEARNLPIGEQIDAVARVLEERFGVKVEAPTVKVRRKNLVGRQVTVYRTDITTRENLDQLLDAFRSMQMLSSILGVPEKAMALELDGKPLTISLVSTKRFGPLGSFGWGAARKITLPGRSNSFAHEWGHALDHYLSHALGRDQKVYPMLSREMDKVGVQRPLHPRAALADAFAGIMAALYGDSAQMSGLVLRLQVDAAQLGPDGKPTPAARQAMKVMQGIRTGRRPPAALLSAYFKSSADYDKLSGAGGYFVDPAEMFARAFEAWVGRTVSAISDLPQGFLSKSAWGYDNQDDPRLAMTFPKGADAEAFGVAMLELQHAMSRSVLFGADAPAARPEDVDIYSDKALLLRLPRTSMLEAEKRATREMAKTWRRWASLAHLKATTAMLADIPRGVWLEYATSLTAAVHATAARQKGAEAKAAFTRIADMIGNDPGSGRLIVQPWQQAVEMAARRNLRRLDGALGKHYQNRELTDAERKTLRALLTGQKVAADPHLKRLAADMRVILDGIWYDLKDAGIEVAYAPGYLPRMPNIDEVDRAPEAFIRDAAKVYALMFQREVIENDDADAQHQDINTVIRRLRRATMPTAEGERVEASRLSEADEELITAWRAAYTALRRLQKQAEKDPLNTKIGDKIAAAEAEVERLQEAVLDMLQERFARYSAENWRLRMRVGHMNDFDRMGPTSSFLRGRTLPPETDAIMERWLQNDPLELTSGYVYAAARRAEYAKRFGAAGEKLEAMLEAAEKDGATSDEIHLVRKAVNSATGRFQHPSKAGERLSSFIFLTGTLAMLGRATFSSLAEPVTAGLRSGQVRDSLHAIFQQVRSLTSGGRREDLFELGRVIGAVTSSMHETLMANRLGADSAALSKTTSALLAKFFSKSLLGPLTNFQRAANLPVAHAIVIRHLRHPSRFANGELNEVGIAEADRADLLAWLEGLQGMPEPDDLLAPDGSFYNRAAELWANAVVRLTDQTIQNPNKGDRPVMANHPMVASLYGIMSFIMSFQRNILVRTLRRGRADKETRLGKTTRSAANVAWAAPAVAMLFGAQLLSTVAREAIFNPTMWQERDDDDELLDWLMRRAFWRTGLTGVFDPLAQFFVGVKYERDLTAIAAGPYLGYLLQNMMTISRAFVGRNSANTNTGEHNATRAFYQALIQPAIMASIAAAGPAGPLTGLFSTGAIWWGSSPQASTEFAERLTGPKGRDYKKEGRGTPWWELAD